MPGLVLLPPPPPPLLLPPHAGKVISAVRMQPRTSHPASPFRREPAPALPSMIPKTGNSSARKILVPRFPFHIDRLALEDPFVLIVRFDVWAVLPGVTELLLNWQAACVGKFPHDRVTACPKLAFTDETVTVTVPVGCPLVAETLDGVAATEKSAGAAATLATNPSASPPP